MSNKKKYTSLRQAGAEDGGEVFGAEFYQRQRRELVGHAVGPPSGEEWLRAGGLRFRSVDGTRCSASPQHGGFVSFVGFRVRLDSR
jgi:hypothetical protein